MITSMHSIGLCLALLGLSLSQAEAAGPSCVEAWSHGFHQPGFNAVIYASVMFDDGRGSGPQLIVAGDFTAVNGLSCNRIARWDGQSWQPLGAGMTNSVYTLAVYDEGSGPRLFAGGAFNQAGEQSGTFALAKWDGTSWSGVGGGVNNTVTALSICDDGSGPALFVGGYFGAAGGLPAAKIAKWDGRSWSTLGNGIGPPDAWVLDIAAYDDGNGVAIYAGGDFVQAGETPVQRIAKWSGGLWSSVAGGVLGPADNTTVECMEVFDAGDGSMLYVGGMFDAADGAQSPGIARWNGSTWLEVGDGVTLMGSGGVGSGRVFDLLVAPAMEDLDPMLLVGGVFDTAGQTPTKHFAGWTGQWNDLGSELNGHVGSLVLDQTQGGRHVYVGGGFTASDPLALNRLAQWDGRTWSSVGVVPGFGASDDVDCVLYVDEDFSQGPSLFAAGRFLSIGGIAANHIARWDGEKWTPLGLGVNNDVNTMIVHELSNGQRVLVVAGEFLDAGGTPARRIAMWDGDLWMPMGEGLGSSTNPAAGGVHSLTHFNGQLVAGGSFSTINGTMTGRRIATWTGNAWVEIGGGLSTGQVNGLVVHDDGIHGPCLYAGGTFNVTQGGVQVSRVVRWNGSAWSSLGNPANYANVRIESLLSADLGDGNGRQLFAAGRFDAIDGVPAKCVARWNGVNWVAMGTGFGNSGFETVNDIAALPGSNQDRLVAVGSFPASSGGILNNAAAWDGTTWTPLGIGTNLSGTSLALIPNDTSLPPGLLVGGAFEFAGGMPVGGIARWGCEASLCVADIAPAGSPDGTVNVDDLLAVINAWGPCADPGNCPADIAPAGPPIGNDAVDVDDLLAVINAWGACP